MVERVASILRHDWREINGSPLIIEFLNIYSILYLNGAQPGTCEKCHKKYWIELNQNGMEKAKRLQELKERTLIPSWNGLKYVPKAARHFSSSNITDSEACEYLRKGQLRESDFKKLPDEWIAFKHKESSEINLQIKESVKEKILPEKKPTPKRSKKAKK